MTGSRKQMLMLGGLVVLMVVVYARALAPRSSGERAPQVTTEFAPHASTMGSGATHRAVSPETLVRREKQRKRAERMAWRRDPFIRSAGSDIVHGFTLSGILWDPNDPIAIVNGETLRVGGQLDGYRVTEISHDRVSISDGTETHQLLIAP